MNKKDKPRKIEIIKSSITDGRARLSITISGIKHIALVDSGASVSIMNLDSFLFLCNRTKQQATLDKSNIALAGVTNDSLKVYGKTQIQNR